uniref:Permease n=1 Tax=Virgibacillus oceani TaxID=1479511 RepID=A0A917HJ34_9BACI|nr:hypothetical protein [Virgibacillus oceani]GGG80969.1 hypothetical protein GCM10011398_27960 [Virgibacillus oceani]
MDSKTGQRTYLTFGILFLLFSALFTMATISTGIFPAGHELVMIGVSVMSFCLAYLYPQFKENDERSRRIREKGMFYSYFFMLGYMIILMSLFQFDLLQLDGYQTVCLLSSLLMMTVFINLVVLARRY